MADTIAAPQTGGGEGVPPAVIPLQAAEPEKPVDAQIVQKNVVPTDQPTQEAANAVAEVVAPPATEVVAPPAAEVVAPPAAEVVAPPAAEIVAPPAAEVVAPPAAEVVAPQAAEVVAPPATEETKEDIKVVKEESKKEESVNLGIKDESTTQEVKPVEPPVDNNANSVDQNTTVPKGTDWQQKESELLKKIEELEKVKSEKGEESLKLQLKVREEEIDLLKARVKNLETELHAALSKPGGKNHEIIENIKQQHEELLSKAKGMIFDKTKMVKNQELQIEALTTQVQSLKDINLITKDLLEIRNSEVKAMEERLQAMEARFKTEKERYGLVLERAQTSSNINDDLKKEYVTQLAIFKELREKYEQRVQALVAENEKLKESVKNGAPNAPSSST